MGDSLYRKMVHSFHEARNRELDRMALSAFNDYTYPLVFNREKTWVVVDGAVCLRETEKALLIRVEGGEHWIPKSQMNEDESDVQTQGDVGSLVISEWIAKEKGLCDFSTS